MAKARKRAAKGKPAPKPAPKKPAPKPAPKKPAPKKSAANKPASKAAANKPAPNKAGANKPAPNKAAANKPAPKKPAPERTATKPVSPVELVPDAVPAEASTPTPIARPTGGGRVVEILDDEHPIDALRRFLWAIEGKLSVQEGQIALGSAQLMLLPIAREGRGGTEVKQLLDLVLGAWDRFPDPTGFHAQEFLRNAFAAVGDDRERLVRLLVVVPDNASTELRFNIAGAQAVVGDKMAMLTWIRAAIVGGATAAQIRRDADFAPYLDDPDLIEVLDGAAAPQIPVQVAPFVRPVRLALDSLVATLRELGQQGRLNPPASLDIVLAAERVRKIQLPNDYRALLTIADGFAIWDNEFFGTKDYRGDTSLAKSAREYLEMSAHYGSTGIDECVPLANWGQPNEWLLYDPRGKIRRGEPGYVLMLDADDQPLENLVAALERLAKVATDVLGTN